MLNSFVKSYIIDRAADAALSSGGVSGVVVNIGGDLVVRGNLTEPVHVSNPLFRCGKQPAHRRSAGSGPRCGYQWELPAAVSTSRAATIRTSWTHEPASLPD